MYKAASTINMPEELMTQVEETARAQNREPEDRKWEIFLDRAAERAKAKGLTEEGRSSVGAGSAPRKRSARSVVLRVTADTNVLISGLLSPQGKPREFLQMARNGEINLTLSHAVLEETADVPA